MVKADNAKNYDGHRSSLFTRLLDLVAPRMCCCCGRRLGETEQFVCLNCLLTLPRTHFASQPEDNIMAQLFWGRIPVERAAAWFFYQPGSPPSKIIHGIKYHRQQEMARFLGRIMAEEMSSEGFFDDGMDILVPVPLTRRRERQRGYNQAREIARGVSDVTGIPVVSDVAVRIRFEASQTSKSGAEREDNVRGVFELVDSVSISHKHLVVVDDVVTTGATVHSLCSELAHAQGVRLSILSAGLTHG